MKNIYLILILTVNIFGWEINTHRAIDQIAINKADNLNTFVVNSGIKNKTYAYEKFEGYGNYTYFKYVTDGEENGLSEDIWRQTFKDTKYKSLIEAGSILEDAQWPHGSYTPGLVDRIDGRFVNHFYDAQFAGSGSNGLFYAGFRFLPSHLWASRGIDTLNRHNQYSFYNALEYFKKGFTEESPTERKKYQAKMLVSLGHMLHLMNDVSSTAHTRGDAHAEGDIMEVWGGGGEKGNQATGFRVVGSNAIAYSGISKNPDNRVPKYSKFTDFITKEAKWTSTHFFSKDSIFVKPLPRKSDTYKELVSSNGDIHKYYIRSDSVNGIPRGTKLAIHVRSYILDELRGKYYTDDRVWMGFNKTTSFQGDYTVIEENARILIPRAIANARNFTNYFFRGQISAKIDGSNITIKNISDPSLVKDRGTIIINPGTFHLKYTTRYDNTMRDFVFERDMDRYEPNIEQIGGGTVRTGGFASLVTLKPGESIVVAIKRDTSILGKNIVVIYDGIIGKERGLAICAASTPDAMRE